MPLYVLETEPDPLKGLKGRRREFVRYMAAGTMNPTKCAEIAGYASPEKEARRLMNDPKIARAVAELGALAGNRVNIDAAWLMEKLRSIIEDDPTQTVTESTRNGETAVKIQTTTGSSNADKVSALRTIAERVWPAVQKHEVGPLSEMPLADKTDAELLGMLGEADPRMLDVTPKRVEVSEPEGE